MREGQPTGSPVPRWLRFVLASDRAGSAWYIGTGFFFAPILALVSPWPAVTAVLWAVIERWVQEYLEATTRLDELNAAASV